MNDFSADLLRGAVSSIMYALLLFVLAKPKYSKRVTTGVIVCVFLVDVLTAFYFYINNDLTTLAKFDILLFAALIILLKPFVTDGIFPWIFNCLTAMNIFAIIVFVSYHLCDYFPYPYYSNSIIRLVLFSLTIGLFHKFVSPFYQQVVDNWRIYLLLVISMFLNFIYYILSSNDIEEMLTDKLIPMSLLSFMCILIYITIFYFQQKTIANYYLLKEKQHYKELAYLDTLTGVQNRNGYENYISHILKMNCNSFCIGVYDVNNLKAANDSLGHEAGDRLISDASRIICTAFKSSAVFRIGGDEFVSVSINISEKEMEVQHHEMLRLLVKYNCSSPYPFDLNIAFGYALQAAPFSVDQLFAKADSNMYRNKMGMKIAQTEARC